MTAKASSSANYNSFFFQQQPQSSNGKHRENVDAAATADVNDLHLKMSKKIAQLTKVIYALNSKNDEYENMIAFMKAQFDQEREQLMQDTSKKLEEFKHKIVSNSDQSKQIAKLDNLVKDYSAQREKAYQEFEQYKHKTSKAEQELVDRFCKKVNDMNKEIDSLKSQYEEQIEQFKAIVAKFDAEKVYLIEDLKSKHRLEIENLKTNFSSNKELFNAERQKLTEAHGAEMEKLQAHIEEMKLTQASEKNDYEQNIKKLRTLHDKELDALKANASMELSGQISALKGELEKLKREKLDSEKELNRRYNEKLEEIVRKDEEIELLTEKLSSIQGNLQASSQDMTVINDDLMRARVESQKLQRKISELEAENESVKEKFERQVQVLLEKTNEISKLEASVMQKTSTVNDLKNELTNMRERLSWLEDEKKALESVSQRQSQNTNSQIKSLEKALDEIRKEKKVLIETYNENQKQLQESHREMIEKLSVETKIREETLLNDYEIKLSKERTDCEEKILTLERNLNREFNTESQKISKDRDRLQNELNRLLDELKLKTFNYESELQELNQKLSKNVKELTEANSSVQSLTKLRDGLEVDLKASQQVFDTEHKKRVYFEDEYEKLTLLLEVSSKDAEIDTKVKLEKLSQELNHKWSETLRKETEALRKNLMAQKEEEFNEAMSQLNHVKDQEIRNLRNSWQAKTNELLEEISELKRQLNEREIESSSQIEKLRKEIDAENKQLKDDMMRLKEEHLEQVRLLESKRDEDVKKIIDNINMDNERKLSDAKARYLEDLQAQMAAQKAAMSSMKAALEKNKNLELEVQDENHSKAMEFMRNDLLQEHYLELDDMKRLHEKEVLTFKMELERALEINKLRERETQIKIEDYQSEVTSRQRRIDSLNSEIKDLKHLVDDLKQEVEIRGSDLQQIKSEAQKEIKNIESQLKREREDEYNTLNAEHIRQKQLLVGEFKHAQDIFKKRIFELEEVLVEMKERFENRESRKEDLDMIHNLKVGLHDREEHIKKLEDEKKFFQRELVNRETNFNKMFNNTPNIGVLNPLSYNSNNKKTSKAAPAASVAPSGKISPTVATRLDPLLPGGSPFHDLTLNPNKPLPKKFLK